MFTETPESLRFHDTDRLRLAATRCLTAIAINFPDMRSLLGDRGALKIVLVLSFAVANTADDDLLLWGSRFVSVRFIPLALPSFLSW